MMKRTMTLERFLTSTALAAVVSLGFLLMLARPADGRAPHSAEASNATPQSSVTSRDQTQSIAPSAAARFPKNVEEFDRMFEDIKDWGQWGPNDQVGAANLITEAKRRQAIALARLGRVVSMAHPYLTASSAAGNGNTFEGNGSPFEHTMKEGFSMKVSAS